MWLALGTGRGTILAEDFFAATYVSMQRKFDAGDLAGARDEQDFKLQASAILSKYGGAAAERALYRRFPLMNFDFGPPRLPARPFGESNWPKLEAELEAIGFWKQLWQP